MKKKKKKKQDAEAMPATTALTEVHRENNTSKLLICLQLCYSMRITTSFPFTLGAVIYHLYLLYCISSSFFHDGTTPRVSAGTVSFFCLRLQA